MIFHFGGKVLPSCCFLSTWNEQHQCLQLLMRSTHDGWFTKLEPMTSGFRGTSYKSEALGCCVINVSTNSGWAETRIHDRWVELLPLFSLWHYMHDIHVKSVPVAQNAINEYSVWDYWRVCKVAWWQCWESYLFFIARAL